MYVYRQAGRLSNREVEKTCKHIQNQAQAITALHTTPVNIAKIRDYNHVFRVIVDVLGPVERV